MHSRNDSSSRLWPPMKLNACQASFHWTSQWVLESQWRRISAIAASECLMTAIHVCAFEPVLRPLTQSAATLLEPPWRQVVEFLVNGLGDQSQVHQDVAGRARHPAGPPLLRPGHTQSCRGPAVMHFFLGHPCERAVGTELLRMNQFGVEEAVHIVGGCPECRRIACRACALGLKLGGLRSGDDHVGTGFECELLPRNSLRRAQRPGQSIFGLRRIGASHRFAGRL